METLRKLSPIFVLIIALSILWLLLELHISVETNQPEPQCVPEEHEYVAEYGYV